MNKYFIFFKSSFRTKWFFLYAVAMGFSFCLLLLGHFFLFVLINLVVAFSVFIDYHLHVGTYDPRQKIERRS